MPSKTTKPIIEVSGLTTQLGGHTILEDLDLTIFSGEIFAIVGGSGSGKTTLLRSLILLQPVQKGEIKLFGKNLINATPDVEREARQNWGVLFQRGALFSSLTVLENVAFPLQEQTDLSPAMVDEIARLKIALVGLAADAIHKYPAELSGGMQKRAALARSTALDPQILFLDEPTAGLDPVGASSLDELVLNLKQSLGLTIIIITHDLDTLWRITDRVAFLGKNKILQTATMSELYQSNIKAVQNYFSDPRSKTARHIREEVG